MKNLFLLAFLVLLFPTTAHAQQFVQLCQNVTTGGTTTCQAISATNPMYISGSGKATSIAIGTTTITGGTPGQLLWNNGGYVGGSTPGPMFTLSSSGFATTEFLDVQTGTTSYNIPAADAGGTVLFNSATIASNVTVGSASAAGYTLGFGVGLVNTGTQSLTFTPGSPSTINGAASVVVPPTAILVPISDGSNFWAGAGSTATLLQFAGNANTSPIVFGNIDTQTNSIWMTPIGTASRTSANQTFSATTASTNIYMPSGGKIDFQNGTTRVGFINSSGNLTLGTTSPFAPNTLTVNGRGSIGIDFLSAQNVAPSNGLIVEGATGIGTATLSSSNTLEVNGAVSIGYPDVYGGNVGGMIVSGKTAIGTSTVPNEFQVYSGTTASSAILDAYNSSYMGLWLMQTATVAGTYNMRSDGASTIINAPSSKIRFYFNDSPFDFFDTQTATIGTSIASTSANALALGQRASIGLGFINSNAPSNGLIVQGNVGIGTASPVTTFAIAGLASDSGLADNTVCVNRTTNGIYFGSGTLGICLGTSSKRFKNPLGDLTEGLSEIMKLKPVKFTYKVGHGDDGLHPQNGFYAEDVISTLPDLVQYDEKGLPNTVDYVGMIPVMVHAIQQQQNELEVTRGSFPFHKCFFGLLVCVD